MHKSNVDWPKHAAYDPYMETETCFAQHVHGPACWVIAFKCIRLIQWRNDIHLGIFVLQMARMNKDFLHGCRERQQKQVLLRHAISSELNLILLSFYPSESECMESVPPTAGMSFVPWFFLCIHVEFVWSFISRHAINQHKIANTLAVVDL